MLKYKMHLRGIKHGSFKSGFETTTIFESDKGFYNEAGLQGQWF